MIKYRMGEYESELERRAQSELAIAKKDNLSLRRQFFHLIGSYYLTGNGVYKVTGEGPGRHFSRIILPPERKKIEKNSPKA
jgi:hypothetical protein